MRAVIFDLWDTLVEWPMDEAARLRERMAALVGVADDEFTQRWSAMYRASQTGPLADAYLTLGVPHDRVEAEVAARHEFARRVLRPRPGATRRPGEAPTPRREAGGAVGLLGGGARPRGRRPSWRASSTSRRSRRTAA